jgi:2'-5' RNA ligase
VTTAAATTTVRAFIALEIPEATRSKIAALAETLSARLRDLRRARAETLHLTVRFLGETTPAQVERLRASLAPAAAACPPCEVRIAGLGLFPERGRPRVLWLGMTLPEPVATLQRACEAAAVRAGFAPERGVFRAHVTLGRWRTPVPRPDLPVVDLGSTAVSSLVLFKSTLDPKGAVHDVLADFALGG